MLYNFKNLQYSYIGDKLLLQAQALVWSLLNKYKIFFQLLSEYTRLLPTGLKLISDSNVRIANMNRVV